MAEISLTQYHIVLNAYSLTIAATGAASAFFLFKRFDVLPRYKTGVTLLGMVSMIAAYNYTRLLASWHEAFTVVGGAVEQTGIPYDDAYRYADWLLTVPMLLVSLVLVLDMPQRQARFRGFVLGTLAMEMIVLGYPGQIATDALTRWLWWTLAMVPFVIIIHQLYFGLAASIRNEPPASRKLVSAARVVTVLAWSVYPVIYVLPLLGLMGTNTFITTQVLYSVADTTAKALYGVLIASIAIVKSQPLADAPVVAAPARVQV